MTKHLGPVSIENDPKASAGSVEAEQTEAGIDAGLVRLVVERGESDERPFTELFRRHRDYVWRLALRWLGNAADAEDVTQEIFVAAHRGLAGFEGRSSFRTWLHRIAVNRCKNALRSRAAFRRVLAPEDATAEAPATASSDPARLEDRELLGGAMQQLRPREREVLTLVEIEGHSYAETAQRLGISLSATKMRLLRAREALREALARIRYSRR